MTTRLITPPTEEPVTLEKVKTQLRVDGTEDDILISSLITAAREQCEHMIKRSILPQTWEQVRSGFGGDNIKLLNPSIISITSIKYIDATTANEVTLSSGQYVLDKDAEPGLLYPANGTSWPSTLCLTNAVRIRYQAGYADEASVPASIKNWIMLAVAEMYNCGCDSLPHDFMDGMLDRYRIWSL